MTNKVVQQGAQAFKRGVFGNPYNKDSNKHKQWEFGYNQEYFKNLDAVLEREGKKKTPRG